MKVGLRDRVCQYVSTDFTGGYQTHLLDWLFDIWFWLTGAESDAPSDEVTMAQNDATRLAEIEEAKDGATDDLILGR